jgi:hypothetical protein
VRERLELNCQASDLLSQRQRVRVREKLELNRRTSDLLS